MFDLKFSWTLNYWHRFTKLQFGACCPNLYERKVAFCPGVAGNRLLQNGGILQPHYMVSLHRHQSGRKMMIHIPLKHWKFIKLHAGTIKKNIRMRTVLKWNYNLQLELNHEWRTKLTFSMG
jgi:hypothetical protein